MAVLNWGKPKIEVCEYDANGFPSNPNWVELPTPVEGTTAMSTTEGEKTEAKEEGGGIVDSQQKKATYALQFALFEKGTKPIDDNDGIVSKNYALRLTPQDTNLNGFILKKCSVGYQYTWTAADGGRWVYTFTALVPDDNSPMIKPYKQGDAI